MESIRSYAREQYQLVKESRAVLFEYCNTIKETDIVNENSSFGRGGSIRNLLVHIANTYQFWIANTALKQQVEYTSYDSMKNINDIIQLFGMVDECMYEYIQSLIQTDQQVQYELNGEINYAPAFKLFTHVITHEYHHKGQILSLSRHLGYIPVDTDIMR